MGERAITAPTTAPTVIGQTIGNAIAAGAVQDSQPIARPVQTPVVEVTPVPTVQLTTNPYGDLTDGLSTDPWTSAGAAQGAGSSTPTDLHPYVMAYDPSSGTYTTSYSPTVRNGDGAISVANGPTYESVTISRPNGNGLGSNWTADSNNNITIHYYDTTTGQHIGDIAEPAYYDNQAYKLSDGTTVTFVPPPAPPSPAPSEYDQIYQQQQQFLQGMRDADPFDVAFRPVGQYLAAHPRAAAVVRGVGAGFEIVGGAVGFAGGAATSETGVGIAVAAGSGALFLHGVDDFQAAWRSFNSNRNISTFTNQGLQALGASPDQANIIEFLGTAGAGGLAGGSAILARSATSSYQALDLGLGQASSLSSSLGTVRGTYTGLVSVGEAGPLPDNLAGTFAGGRYDVVTLSQDTVLYRAGTSNQPLGQFFSPTEPQGVLQTRIDQAVLPVWPNGATSPLDTAFAVKVPAGTEVYVGRISTQGGAYVGGADQVVVVKPWTIPSVEVVGAKPIR